MCVCTALMLALASACNIDPFRIGGGADDDGDSGVDNGDGGGNDTDGGEMNMPDAGPPPDACIPFPETCDEADNDCDGNVDEDFDLTADPNNCGTCGNACALQGAEGTCNSGSCEYECSPLYHDLNMDLNMMGSNGCEYGPCDGMAGDPETCDGQDDDCDGTIDEDVPNLDDDPMNCGECFKQCIAVNVVTTQCNGGDCGYDACVDDKDADGNPGTDGKPDYEDVNPLVLGCEYPCPVIPRADPGAELCNGIDDDCDGTIDELPIVGLGDPCYPSGAAGCTDDGMGGYNCEGVCGAGVMSCNLGVPECTGYDLPETAEQCDGTDHDCDGDPYTGNNTPQTTDTFDIMNDPNHCGTTCTVCDLPNAIEECVAGVCGVDTCLPGWQNPDMDDTDGCDYECTKTGAEVCDGKDNDCDEGVDETTNPPPDGLPTAPDICNQNGACSGTVAQCAQDPCDGTSPTLWRCLYDSQPNTETDGCGNLLFEETLCDTIDGDCDTATDEAYPVDADCDDGLDGICKGTGKLICDLDDPELDATKCNITNPGQSSTAEVCNNLDDDCNGMVDDNAADDMIGIDIPPTDGVIDFYIDTYEASRPDATDSTAGVVEDLSCSNPDVLPWRIVTWPDAEAACQANGKRLCTKDEWQLACVGASGNVYPYGNTYDALACNGYDYDEDYADVTVAGQCNGVQNNQENVLPTGFDYDCLSSPDTCVSEYGVYDMSGNLREWTGEDMGGNARLVTGGAYVSIEDGLACTDEFLVFDNTVKMPTLGFRCCKDGP